MEDKEENTEEVIDHQGWIDYRNSVIENKTKSQDDFEKYINLMASGGLVLSLTFLEKIVSLDKAIWKSLVVIGMYLMVLTLLSNLYSHYKSMLDSDATIKDIDDNNYEKIFKNIEKRNQKINFLNKVSIWSLIIGILCLITFVTINIYNMSDKQKITPRPKPATEEKGRTITPPSSRPSNPPPKK
ncbi:hypothetical protein SD960_22115 [Flavobacterium sp. MMLR14_040]|uniref:hypothetical protein n=1 Tax=Flavobacterium sp. MMLR14_040 TaxID=3093843 RepID=UPI002990817C|nr:hypothetical protein [Flavobacterium sp. MMLR14_040]MDW8852810.1 hypothetical protein [Flavobacterium sp. MMLR14_040]